MVEKLKDSGYKNNIMREACEVFYNRNFEQKLGMNPFIIGFKNGVYDLKLDIFRAGRPEDYVNKQMPINYINFSKTDKRVLAIDDYLEKVFPDSSIRTYFLDTMSDIFEGGNPQKTISFWTGEGDNAKSVTQSFFEKMLGPYAVKISTTLVTGKKTSIGQASPELARTGGGVRYCVIEEPDTDERLNIGILKSLSGNDSFWARDLFATGKNTKEILPLFKICFICNGLPPPRNADKAFWNRVKVIPFESTFVKSGDDCPQDPAEQLLQKRFPRDPNFDKKIPELLEPFAWKLLDHRKSIKGKGRVEPEKVRMATELYRRQNDNYRQFSEECIVEEEKAELRLQDLYNGYKEWFKNGYPGHQLPLRNDIQQYFTKYWGDPEPGLLWRGYTIKLIHNEETEGDTFIVKQPNEDDDINSISPSPKKFKKRILSPV